MGASTVSDIVCHIMVFSMGIALCSPFIFLKAPQGARIGLK